MARFRNTIKVNEPMPFDDGAPAIDGLYIFPEPQEVVRDDGFVEFRVTAYGRTGVDAPLEISTVRGTLQIDYGGTPRLIISGNAIFENYVLRKVFHSNESIESLLSPSDIIPQAYIGGRVYRTGTYDVTRFSRFEYDIRMFLRECTTANFGIWSEYTISYQSYGSARFVLSLSVS